ncbi:hypothetical protein LAZ67_7001102 [Cordylochernes scorpioides]|uniref:Uncharacterized protein n=1 Tax=Cordylochernes scorpioides TaxID=51811 RepID=A0ABY6KM13_9ARAC|nr:hypothetical protein LAZ67_7001102 [Cordylochernes scorpioides]
MRANRQKHIFLMTDTFYFTHTINKLYKLDTLKSSSFLSPLNHIRVSSFDNHHDWEHYSVAGRLSSERYGCSDMRNRHHVQQLTWSTNSIPGLGALTGYYQPGQLGPGFLVDIGEPLGGFTTDEPSLPNKYFFITVRTV